MRKNDDFKQRTACEFDTKSLISYFVPSDLPIIYLYFEIIIKYHDPTHSFINIWHHQNDIK